MILQNMLPIPSKRSISNIMIQNRVEKLKKLQYLCAHLPNGIICETPYGKLKLLGINVADGNNNAILNFGVDKEGYPIEFYVSEIGSVEVPLLKEFASKLTQINK